MATLAQLKDEGFHLGIHGVEPAQHFEPVKFWNTDIKNDQVRQAFADHLYRITTVICFADDFIAFVFQQHSNRQPYNRVVIDDEN